MLPLIWWVFRFCFYLILLLNVLLLSHFLWWLQDPLGVQLDHPGSLTLAMCQLLNEIQETKKGIVTPRELFAQVCKKWVHLQAFYEDTLKTFWFFFFLLSVFGCMLSPAGLPGSKVSSSKTAKSCFATFWMGCGLRKSKSALAFGLV